MLGDGGITNPPQNGGFVVIRGVSFGQYIDERVNQAVTESRRERDLLRRHLDRLEELQGEFLRIDAYEGRHEGLEKRLDRTSDSLIMLLPREAWEEWKQAFEKRLYDLEQWQANIMGRFVAIGVVGAITVAVIGAFVGHLLGA